MTRTYESERERRWRRQGIVNSKGEDLTYEEHKAMLKEQRYKCAICGVPINGNSAVDHNHATGKARGLLCQPCNMALGVLEPHLGHVMAYLQLAEESEEEQAEDEPHDYPDTPPGDIARRHQATIAEQDMTRYIW